MNREQIATMKNYSYSYSSLKLKDMYGAKKVAVFCVLTVVIPTLLIIMPLYLRHNVYADVMYAVTESDVLEIHRGLSTVFCQQHSLKMNTSFNAFQVDHTSEITNTRKHIQLKKSMTLPDDTLEYWGFYLLKGAVVELKVCSRFQGSNLLVVRGDRNLNTCDLLNDLSNKIDPVLAKGHEKVSVAFESDSGNRPSNRLSEKYKNVENRHKTNKSTKTTKNKVKSREVEMFVEREDMDKIDFNDSKINNLNIGRSRRHVKKNPKKTDQGHYPQHVLDRRINHGGNAINHSQEVEDSASSFENGLLECFDGRVLLNQEFPPSKSCKNVEFLETHPHLKMITTHEVITDGYYYYIFYSDNDLMSNDIYAIFDIYKPSFQYSNMTQAKSCINKTECSFLLSVWSDEIVVVEIPTKDGIAHQADDITWLTSTCHPRMTVYLFFPTAVLFIILGCAFV